MSKPEIITLTRNLKERLKDIQWWAHIEEPIHEHQIFFFKEDLNSWINAYATSK